MRRTVQGLLSPSEQIVKRGRERIVLIVTKKTGSYTVTIDSKDSQQGRAPIPTARDFAIADRAMRAFFKLKEPSKKRKR